MNHQFKYNRVGAVEFKTHYLTAHHVPPDVPTTFGQFNDAATLATVVVTDSPITSSIMTKRAGNTTFLDNYGDTTTCQAYAFPLNRRFTICPYFKYVIASGGSDHTWHRVYRLEIDPIYNTIRAKDLLNNICSEHVLQDTWVWVMPNLGDTHRRAYIGSKTEIINGRLYFIVAAVGKSLDTEGAGQRALVFSSLDLHLDSTKSAAITL